MKEQACGCGQENKKGFSRRQFLSLAGWGAFIASLGVLVASTARFLFPRVIFEPPTTFKIGFLEDFKATGTPDKHNVLYVDEKWKQSERAWIVREKDRLYAMSTKCTHLGCTPNWFSEDGIFKCPCHGSQYYGNGVNFAGPAPRPLDRFAISIAQDGQIIVDKAKLYSVKEFDVPGSFVRVKGG